jgi:hypothetical protein
MKALQFYKTRDYNKFTDFSLHCWHNDKGQVHFFGCNSFSCGLDKAKKIRDKLNEAIAQIEAENNK